MPSAQEFLIKEFELRKKRNPNFSLRSFAKWLFISPAQLSQMMTGKRPITVKSMKKILARLGLSPREKKNVMLDLFQDQGSIEPTEERKKLRLQDDQFLIISDWYHFAILSLTKLKGAKADPSWIAARLGIKIEQANQAVLRLLRLKIIQIKPQFKQISDPLEVVSTTPSEAIQKYHKQNLNLALEKIEMVPVSFRQFQSITIPANPKNMAAFQSLIDDFLDQAAILAKETNPTEIYNLNVQFFPVTKIKELP